MSVEGSASKADGKDELPAQKWELTADSSPDPHESSGKPTGPQHSYDRRFLQVLPDVGRSYPGRGQHLQHASQLIDNGGGGGTSASGDGDGGGSDGDSGGGSSPYVSFVLKVEKGGEGIHTLFLRWTGGDTVGGGDSLYVVLYKRTRKRKGQFDLDLVHGQQTVKPAVVPIDAGMSRYAGCCYDRVTHACPCYSEKPDYGDNSTNSVCPEESFIDRTRAASFGVQCLVGGGAYTIVRSPEWYLYAGQEAGDVMDFDSEPWDVTCEAEGSNTIDSGHDFPSWVLHETSFYELRVYAREDGTALDGIYVAGPRGRAPALAKRYAKGDSTICERRGGRNASSPYSIAAAVVGIVGLVALGGWVYSTTVGREVLGSVLNKPAQAVRYVYVDNST